jgi:hypothetical protein
MAITAGQNALASDFITKAEKNATPANDSGRVPQLETDGKLHGFFTKNGQVLNAGATINGATLPVPVYQDKTDNEVYACDANDATKYKFIGFATSNGTDANPIDVQFSGVVGGFSGLDEGQKYYVSDTVGTISNAPGTQEILVGVAISTTELFIQKGKRFASGTASFDATGTSAVTLGFRPSKVRVHAVGMSTGLSAISHGRWDVMGGNRCTYGSVSPSGGASAGASGMDTVAWRLTNTAGGSNYHSGTITTITDTGFTLDNTEGTNGETAYLYWEAEGEL